MALFFLITTVIVLIVYLIKYVRFSMPDNFPPGPLRLPVTGSYLQLLVENYRFPYKALDAMAKHYKTNILGMYLGPFLSVVACDQKSVREALSHPDLQGRPDAFALRLRCRGELLGIIFADGELWNGQKRFMLQYMRDFGFGRRFVSYEEKLKEEAQDLIEIIHKGNSEYAKGNSVFIPALFYDIGANLLLSIYSNNKYSNGELKNKLFNTLIPNALAIEPTGGALNFHPWLRFLAPDTCGYTANINGIRDARKFVSELIEEHKANKTDDTVMDFIDVFLQEMKNIAEKGENKTMFSEHQLLLIGFDMLFASTITHSFTMGMVIEYMLHYPEVQKNVQEEIDAVVGQNRLPDLNDRQSMPYTEATLREVMRHETLVPLSVFHRATKDTVFCGYNIPENTLILLNLYSANTDPKIWDHPEKFEPRRFLDSNGKLVKKDMSIPFGIGKRVCAGETFARQNLFIIFSSLLQNFTFSLLPGQKLPDLNKRLPGIAVSPARTWVKVTPRN